LAGKKLLYTLPKKAKESFIKLSIEDTIAAIITPAGEGGIGAIRIAGPKSADIIRKIFRPVDKNVIILAPFHLYYGHIVDKSGDVIDEVTMVPMPAGHSYTGQSQAEIFCHGGQFVLRRILEEIFKYDIRPAEPGEFTRRAFLAGRIDLARAEAVAEMVAAKTEYAYNTAKNNLLGRLSEKIEAIRSRAVDLLAEIEASVDYPEEELDVADREKWEENIGAIIGDIRKLIETYKAGRIIKEGYRIAIAGRPNAGKSSLFNLLLNQNRAIVSPTPGTTRDYLTEWIDIDGFAVSLTDTAGLRNRPGPIERVGQNSALQIMNESDLVIWLIDSTEKNWRGRLVSDIKKVENGNILLLLNKIDLLKKTRKLTEDETMADLHYIPFSCRTEVGLNGLRKELLNRIHGNAPDLSDRLVVTSARHKKKLEQAVKYFRRGYKNIGKDESPELIAFELRQAVNEIDEITGRIYNEVILDRIFERFCIGK
jgi:tRNA modification GTPase